MSKTSAHLGFPAEAPHEARVPGEAFGDDLDSHVALQPLVARAVDGGLPPEPRRSSKR